MTSCICSTCSYVNIKGVYTCSQCGTALVAKNKNKKCMHFDVTDVQNPLKKLGVQSELIGRDVELAVLFDVVSEAFETKTAHLITVCGEEGIGKTRLINELDVLIQQKCDQGLLLHSNGNSPERAFSVFFELLQDRFYVSEDALPRIVRRRFEEGISTLLGENGLEAAHQIGFLIGVNFPGSPWLQKETGAKEAARRALMRLFRVDATSEPIILIIDNAQFMGKETQRLIKDIFYELADVPIIIILIGESSEQLLSTNIDPEHTKVVKIALQPLKNKEIQNLVRNLLRQVNDLSEDIVLHIAEHTIGNPLVAEELIHILIADGVIRVEEDCWTIDKNTMINLPNDFEAVIQRRVAQFCDKEHAFLAKAALIGRSFWENALLALERNSFETNWDDQKAEERIHCMLNKLVEQNVIREKLSSSILFDREFVFQHAAEQRLFRTMLSKEKKQEAHLLIAQWLCVSTHQNKDRFFAKIARHYEVSKHYEKAAEYYVKAGNVAKHHFANEHAVLYFEKALHLLRNDDLFSRLQILHDLGTLYDLAGEHERAIPLFEELALLAWQLNSREKGGVAFNKLGKVHTILGLFEQAMEDLERAMELFSQVDDQIGIASTLDAMGKIFWIRDEYDLAQQHYTRALAKRRDCKNRRAIALSLNNIGMLLVHQGEFSEGLRNFREALALRKKIKDIRGIAQSLNAIAVIFHEQGETSQAMQLWKEALEPANEVGDNFLIGMIYNNLGEALIYDGQLTSAEKHLQTACSLSEDTGERRLFFDVIRNLGVLQAKKGHYSLAITLVEEALDVARSLGSGVLIGIAHRTLGELQSQTLFDTEKTDQKEIQAKINFKKSIQIFETLGNDSELVHAYNSFGLFLIERDNHIKGKRFLQKAKEILGKLSRSIPQISPLN